MLTLYSVFNTVQKLKFSIKDFFSKCDQICSFLQETADLVTFTEEILNGKLHFCAVYYNKGQMHLKKLILKSSINHLSANFTKWSNTLKKFVGKLTTNCLGVFDHFVGLAFKGLTYLQKVCYQGNLFSKYIKQV